MVPSNKYWFSVLVLTVILGNAVAKKPHILYILMDDQGYGDVGYTNQTDDIKTPLLDKMAREGLILDRHYSTWMCTPTRASILTGKYHSKLGIQYGVFVPHTEQCLNKTELLLPEVVRHNGYATHLVGKWHLGYAHWHCMPCMRGFDTAYGFINGETDWLNHTCGGYHDFYECAYSSETGLRWDALTDDNGTYTQDLYSRRVKHLIQHHHHEQTPMFLYLSMQSVHEPYFAPAEYYDCTDNDRCTMQAMMNASEKLLEDVISHFKEAGMWDDTLVIYHSDNGAPNKNVASNGNLRGYKHSLWEGGLRTVGFLYSVNHQILRHRGRTSCYVHVSDWYQTIISITGGWEAYINAADGNAMPAELDSIDQSSYLLSKSTNTCPRTSILLHMDPVKRIAAAIKNQYKLLIGNVVNNRYMCHATRYYELNLESFNFTNVRMYNIFSDPNETTDISDDYPHIVSVISNYVRGTVNHQAPLQCQLPVDEDGYPNDDVPYYLPWL